MMHTVVKSHRSGRDVVPKKFVDEICGVLQDADIGLRKYAIKDFRTYIPVKLKELGWSDNIYLDRTSKIVLYYIGKQRRPIIRIDSRYCRQLGTYRAGTGAENAHRRANGARRQ